MSEPEAASPPKKSGGMRVPKWVDKALLVVGLGLLGYVISRYPLADIWAAVAGMFPYVLLTPVIAVAWFCTSTMAMFLLLDRRVPWLRILWIRLVGDSYNALLPAAGFGGEPFKVRQLSYTVETPTVMATLIRDRIVDNAMGFLFGATELVLGTMAYTVDVSVRSGLYIYIVVCATLGFAGLALLLTRLPGRFGGWLAKVLGDVAPEQVPTLPLGRVLQVAACFFLSRMLGLLEKVTLLWILGLPHDLVTAGFVDGFLSGAGYLGFMIPQGLGAFEVATVYIVKFLGGTGPQGLAFAFARRGRMLVVGLFGISLHLVVVLRDALRRWLAARVGR